MIQKGLRRRFFHPPWIPVWEAFRRLDSGRMQRAGVGRATGRGCGGPAGPRPCFAQNLVPSAGRATGCLATGGAVGTGLVPPQSPGRPGRDGRECPPRPLVADRLRAGQGHATAAKDDLPWEWGVSQQAVCKWKH